MPYVTAVLTDGLGNRLFQIATMLGYAERYGHTPVIVNEWNCVNKHSREDSLMQLFPELPRISAGSAGEWEEFKMSAEEAFAWREIPRTAGNLRLHGYFQNTRYLPAEPILPRALLQIDILDVSRHAFLHVRRGDYLRYAEHWIDLGSYWDSAMKLFEDKEIVVISNDTPWCRERFTGERYQFADVGELDTLATMTRCRQGGICANSPFSWWGAYFNYTLFGLEGTLGGGPWCFPARWVNPPLPHADGIYPAWGLKIPV